jgi:hypothetical protein
VAKCGRDIFRQGLADPVEVSQNHADILLALLITGTVSPWLSWQLKGHGAPIACRRIETDSGKVIPIPQEHSLGDLVWAEFPAYGQIVEVALTLLVGGVP